MTTVTSDIDVVGVAFGKNRVDLDSLPVQTRISILREFIKRYVTPEMVKFMPLWDLASKRPSQISHGLSHDGARILEKNLAIRMSCPMPLKKGDQFYVLHSVSGLPDPVKAEFWPEDRIEKALVHKGDAFESDALLVHGNDIVRWKSRWIASEEKEYTDISGQKYSRRALTWRAESVYLVVLPDSELDDFFDAPGAINRVLWHITGALDKRRNNLERKLQRFLEREGDFYSDSYKFKGPTKH